MPKRHQPSTNKNGKSPRPLRLNGQKSKERWKIGSKRFFGNVWNSFVSGRAEFSQVEKSTLDFDALARRLARDNLDVEWKYTTELEALLQDFQTMRGSSSVLRDFLGNLNHEFGIKLYPKDGLNSYIKSRWLKMMLRGVQNQPWSEWIRRNEKVRKWDDFFLNYIINRSSPPHQSRVFLHSSRISS